MVSLGYDKVLDRAVEERFGEWQGPHCCGCERDIYIDDMHTDEAYETPEGLMCWSCAWDLAVKCVEEEHEDEDHEYDDWYEEEANEIMDEWRVA